MVNRMLKSVSADSVCQRKSARTTAAVRKLAYSGVCVALIAALSQISVPLPAGIPVTLQTFAVAFAGCLLGRKGGIIAVTVYLLAGAVGVPVFANFTGGLYKLIGVTGGFLWGFLPMTVLISSGASRGPIVGILCGTAGLAVCHIMGIAQFAAVTEGSFLQAFTVASAPYLIKDVLSVASAYYIASAVKRSLRTGDR